MRIRVFVEHGLDPELTDYLEKLDTYSWLEVCGQYVVLSVEDPETIPADIKKIAREVARIQKIYNKVGYPWIAREVLDGKAYIRDGVLVYKPQYRPGPLKKMLELVIGPMSPKDFETIMAAATDDIKANRTSFNKKTQIEEVIKIAAQCAEALKRCGR